MIKGKKGFTLVETIVAIALIGIIAVGIIPAFAAQFKMTIDSREITSIGFDAQGAMENDIQSVQELLKESGLFGGDLPKTNQRIFGREVSLFEISKEYPLNNNKRFIVFLSEKMAEMSYRNPLIANLVRIDGEENNGTVTTGIEVASIRGSSTLKMVKGAYQIEDYVSSQDLNLYRWYRSVEGISDPIFPRDYELVDAWRNRKTILKDDLKEYAANRYLMLSLVPVDKSGVRGDEKPSANRVYIQGEEWRSGILAWVDKNADVSYTTDDVSVMYGESSNRTNWVLLNGFNSKEKFPSPANPDIKLDPSDGSLYVPMGVERSRNTDRVGAITLSAADSGKLIRWTADKSIHLANAITVRNHSDIEMKTTDGSITLYQYVDINTSNAEAKYGSDGRVLLYNGGAKLDADENIILTAGDRWGNISLEPYSSLTAAKNIDLTAAENILIKESRLTAGENITLKSKKNDFTMENTPISAKNLILQSSGTMKGGSWSAGTKVVVPDGIILTAGKGAGTVKVDNAGSLELGNTGGIAFISGPALDLVNPLILSLEGKDSNKVEISTNYGRNVACAAPSDYESIGTSGSFQNLGSGQSNLKYTVTKRSGSGSPNLTYSYDGEKTIAIAASGIETDGYANYYEMTVGDCYADRVTGTISFCVYASENESPVVSVEEGSTALKRTVTFDGNGGTVSEISRDAELGKPLGSLPKPPTRQGYKFLGWKTGTGAVFDENTSVIANLTVYAQWEVNTVPQVTVRFIRNYNSSDNSIVDTKTIDKGSALGNLFPSNPVRSGYSFDGWNTLRSGSGGVAFTKDTIVNANTDAFARWKARTTFGAISPGAYISIDGVLFQKIGNNRLLARNYIVQKGSSKTEMTWPEAYSLANGYYSSFGLGWITGSGLVDYSTLSGLNRTSIRQRDYYWWGGESSTYYAYRVDLSGNYEERPKDPTVSYYYYYDYSCRPYITVDAGKLYVNGGSGTSATDPYILVWEN